LLVAAIAPVLAVVESVLAVVEPVLLSCRSCSLKAANST